MWSLFRIGHRCACDFRIEFYSRGGTRGEGANTNQELHSVHRVRRRFRPMDGKYREIYTGALAHRCFSRGIRDLAKECSWSNVLDYEHDYRALNQGLGGGGGMLYW